MTNLVFSLIDFMSRHHRRAFPLLERVFAEGFRFEFDGPDGAVDLADLMNEMRDDPLGHAQRLLDFDAARGGRVALWDRDEPLAHLRYGDGWSARVVLLFFDNRHFDLMAMREKLADIFDSDDLETFLELAIGFLAELGDVPFGYSLEMKAGPFLEAKFVKRQLDVRLVDLPAWFRMMLFLIRRTDPTQLVRSPLEVMRLFDQAQDTIRFMAETYEENEVALVVRFEKDRLFRCGHGVRPTLGSRFGPTAIHLDVLAGVLKAAMPGRGE